jgi:hypothetical protein
MKKYSMIICTLLFLILFSVSNSFAVDFGFYLDFGGGSGEAEFDVAYSEEFDIDTNYFNLGFQFETNPLTLKNVFSYRFQAGFERRDIEDEEDTTLELGGLVINNTFSFGGNVSEKIRLWGGPQILVGFYSGETDKEYLGDEISYSGFGFGLGIAGGANFGLGSSAILTTTIGVRGVGIAGQAEWYDEDEALTGNLSEVFFSIGMLF